MAYSVRKVGTAAIAVGVVFLFFGVVFLMSMLVDGFSPGDPNIGWVWAMVGVGLALVVAGGLYMLAQPGAR